MKLPKIYSVVVIYTIMMYISDLSIAAPKSSSGPYRSTMVRSEPCAKPSRPYEKVPTATFHAELYNTTKKQNLMRGTATILRDNRNLMLRFKGFFMENGKWQLSYVFNNVGCKGGMIQVLIAVIDLKYDRNNCSAAKGTYKFENMDFNELDHKWAKEREYGRVLWVSEAYSKTAVVACWEIETLVSPL